MERCTYFLSDVALSWRVGYGDTWHTQYNFSLFLNNYPSLRPFLWGSADTRLQLALVTSQWADSHHKMHLFLSVGTANFHSLV